MRLDQIRIDALLERARAYCRSEEDRIHLESATREALRILESEEAEEQIVLPAIILHDVGWSQLSAGEERQARGPGIENLKLNHRHEIEGARLAREILGPLGFEPEQIEEIADIIEWHDNRRWPRSGNDAIVKDADKLSRFTPECVRAFCDKFGKSEAEFLRFLTAEVDTWFFTATARIGARRYLRKHVVQSAVASGGAEVERFYDTIIQLEDRLVFEARADLERMAVCAVKQRVADVKRTIEVYLAAHSGATLEALQRSPEFNAIAVQTINETGYTALIDIASSSATYGCPIFHQDERVVNKSMEQLRTERPEDFAHGFWDWYQRAMDGEEFHSYYRSKDRLDRIRDKFQYAVSIRVAGFEWSLVATAFNDEFLKAADEMSRRIASAIDSVLSEIERMQQPKPNHSTG